MRYCKPIKDANYAKQTSEEELVVFRCGRISITAIHNGREVPGCYRSSCYFLTPYIIMILFKCSITGCITYGTSRLDKITLLSELKIYNMVSKRNWCFFSPKMSNTIMPSPLGRHLSVVTRLKGMDVVCCKKKKKVYERDIVLCA